MSANATESIEVRARHRLRALRREQGLTLAAVAERASLDVSTLSRLESGKRRLSLDHLPALAAALGVSTDQLLSAPVQLDPRVHGRPVRRHQLTAWPLNRRGGPGLQAYRVVVDARRHTPPDPLPVHEGYDCIHVLRGRMRLLLGPEELIIEPGETVEFSTWTPHWFGVVAEPVELLLLVGADGAHEHLAS